MIQIKQSCLFCGSVGHDPETQCKNNEIQNTSECGLSDWISAGLVFLDCITTSTWSCPIMLRSPKTHLNTKCIALNNLMLIFWSVLVFFCLLSHERSVLSKHISCPYETQYVLQPHNCVPAVDSHLSNSMGPLFFCFRTTPELPWSRAAHQNATALLSATVSKHGWLLKYISCRFNLSYMLYLIWNLRP